MQKGALELIFDREVQELFDHFCSLLGIRIAFFEAGRREVVVGLDKPSCRFCRLLRGRLDREKRCREQDVAMLDEARSSGRMVSYRCHAGLNEAIVPVGIGGQHVGFVMIGQFRSTRRMSSPLESEWRRKHGNGDLRDAFEAVPYYTRKKVTDILGMFRLFVGSIVSRGLVAARREDVLERVLAVMRERPEAPLTLEEAARLAGRSVSTVSHLFSRELGVSFKRSQIEARLDRAEKMLRSTPDITVKEVAYSLGYNDPLYFSRIFKKHRGVPPSSLIRA